MFVELSSADDCRHDGRDRIHLEHRPRIGDEEAKVEQFRELADAVGATLGCSRPIADAGWLPKSRQVGQYRQTAIALVSSTLRWACPEPIQHLAGMKHVNTIVAVNSDSRAHRFSPSPHYGIVGDIFEVAA